MRYMLSDYVLLNLGWFTFNVVRYYSLPADWAGPIGGFLLLPSVILGQCVLPLLAIGLYAISGYYNRPYEKSRVDDVLNTAGVSALSALMMFFAVLVNDTIPERLLNYQLLLILWFLLAVPVYAGRYAVTASVKRAISGGRLRFATLVVGTGARARAVAERIRRVPTSMGFDIIGFVAADGDCGADGEYMSMEEACSLVRDGIVANVILADENCDVSETARLLGLFLPLHCSIYMAPDLYGLLTMRPRVNSVANEPLVNIGSAGVSAATANMKRVGDVLLSALALVLLAPVYMVIAVAVKADSPGPAFYSQERVGLHNRPFKMYKFRSMRVNTGQDTSWSSDRDVRKTKFGAFLRKCSLDELPQFFNVLKGEMSLVGPRPELPFFVEQFKEDVPLYMVKHQVRPGITGWAQINGLRGDTSIKARVEHDIYYIEHWSLMFDIEILLATVFKGKFMNSEVLS